MKNSLIVLSLAAAITLMASFGFAGTATMRVTVPFDFYVGSESLPAGNYTFEMGSGLMPTASLVTIRTEDGTGICMFVTQTGTDANSGNLLFNRYGHKHFLSSISIRGFKAVLKTQALEKELRAQSYRESRVITIAQR